MSKKNNTLMMAIGGIVIQSAFQTVSAEELASAIFSGGCFWCMEKPFDSIPGVISTTPGYINGTTENPSYKQVSSGTTGHYEAIKIDFNPEKTSYQQLLAIFWRNIDPTNDKGQFCDTGPQYRSAIFYQNEQQRKEAEQSKAKLIKTKPFPEPVVTNILPAKQFYPAESYHHDYYLNHSITYKFYRFTCGRDNRLEELWGNW